MNTTISTTKYTTRLSYWLDTAPPVRHPKLDHAEKADAVVAGGGLCGITTALLLQQKGLQTVLLEARHLAYGASGHTTAKLTSQHGLKYTLLQKHKGYEKAFQYAQAQQHALTMITQLIDKHQLNCDYSGQTSYVYAEQPQDIELLVKEYQITKALKLPVKLLTEVPLPFKNYGALAMEKQAQFNPVKYILGLSKILKGVYENSPVFRIDIGPPHIVYTPQGRVQADYLVIASHFPIINKSGLYFARIEVQRSYIIMLKVANFTQTGMYINAQGPVCSLRQVKPAGNLILLGGEGHPTGSYQKPHSPYTYLLTSAQQRFTDVRPLYGWSAQDCLTLDGVPYIGQIAPNVKNIFVATGFGKWGMTNGTAAAMIISDLITGKHNPYAKVFDPKRLDILNKGGKVLSHGCQFAQNIIRRIFYIPSIKLQQIKKGTGGLITYKTKKLGIYRDANNKIYAVLPYCTHMGCLLRWNQAELSWDCPCHASRYTYSGKVIESPALQPLTTVIIHEEERDGNNF